MKRCSFLTDDLEELSQLTLWLMYSMCVSHCVCVRECVCSVCLSVFCLSVTITRIPQNQHCMHAWHADLEMLQFQSHLD